MPPKIYQRKPASIPYTPDGYRELLEERETLRARRPHAVSELKKGRDMGDLSENGYYKAARAELSFLDKRLRMIDRLVKQAVVVEPRTDGRIDIGNRVTVKNDTITKTYTIVGGYESDPSKGTISHRSPIGSALVGKGVGDEVTVSVPSGLVRYLIEAVS